MSQGYVEQREGGFYIRNSRVPLDSIVHEFCSGVSPESIRQTFPTLTLEQVYGAITYYLGHQDEVEASIQDAEGAWKKFESEHAVPQPTLDRLREARERATPRRQR